MYKRQDSLSEYGPAELDLKEVLPLLGNLGREIRLISAEPGDPDFRQRQKEVWEAVRESIDRGVPAVAKVGPFFWLVRGYHPEDKVYYFSAFMPQLEEPLEADGLGEDGGLVVLFFGRRTRVDTTRVVRESLEFALREARWKAPEGAKYFRGLEALKKWAQMLEDGRMVPGFGPGYTAMVTSEARRFASVYLKEVAPRFRGDAAEALRKAARLYREEARKLGEVRRIFPLHREPATLSPEDLRRAAQLVREAGELEERAVEAIGRALEEM